MGGSSRKYCALCKERFFKRQNCSKKEWSKSRFCSRLCADTYRKGKPLEHKGQFKKGMTPWNKGLTKETNSSMALVAESKMGSKNPSKRPEIRAKISQTQKGRELDDKHHCWKGDDVGYGALHSWVRRRLGKPARCEHCKTKTAKRYEWANVSGEYQRNLDDWIRLCKKCHNLYDDIYTKVWAVRRQN